MTKLTEQSTPLKENVVQKEKETPPQPQPEVIQDVIAAAASATTAPATTIVTPAIPAGDCAYYLVAIIQSVISHICMECMRLDVEQNDECDYRRGAVYSILSSN